MQFKKILLGLVSGSMIFFFTACTSTTESDGKDAKTIGSVTSTERTSRSQKELEEILEKTIPGTDNHFETNEEGLEDFVRYVEEFSPLIEQSMIDKIRENGELYFTEDQMVRLNKAFDESSAL
ncbi:hypothetical protein A5821_003139 [Enterococcus sp. 7F3_DIV0205]|uniref:Lipoprotein n=1 Tax=Candidatus Enterococcus palustris TaxID=1834189 RepID=A0AAQ3WC99_9ENTE|nr:hypothetical protein [Enterococcus sp. 7F3_DIV0205]OTN83573.1 hypothetical protein A5821_003496 [Enterococcus sp. 7F3_DIV0205]